MTKQRLVTKMFARTQIARTLNQKTDDERNAAMTIALEQAFRGDAE